MLCYYYYLLLLKSPIDAKTSGLKRPSKELKKTPGRGQNAKKALGVVRGIKKVVAFPSKNIFGLAS
jgi:hypothetical protein